MFIKCCEVFNNDLSKEASSSVNLTKYNMQHLPLMVYMPLMDNLVCYLI